MSRNIITRIVLVLLVLNFFYLRWNDEYNSYNLRVEKTYEELSGLNTLLKKLMIDNVEFVGKSLYELSDYVDYTSVLEEEQNNHDFFKTLNDEDSFSSLETKSDKQNVCNLIDYIDYKDLQEVDNGESLSLIDDLYSKKMKINKEYYQLRFINVDGQELIRYVRKNVSDNSYFNNNNYLKIESNKLPNHKHSDFLNELLYLNSDEVYMYNISMIDKIDIIDQRQLITNRPIATYAKKVYKGKEHIGYVLIDLDLTYIISDIYEIINNETYVKIISPKTDEYVFSANSSEMFASKYGRDIYYTSFRDEAKWIDSPDNGKFSIDEKIGIGQLYDISNEILKVRSDSFLVGDTQLIILTYSIGTYKGIALSKGIDVYFSIIINDIFLLLGSILIILCLFELYLKKNEKKIEYEEFKKFINNIVHVAEGITYKKDEVTGHHVHRVSEYSKIIAEKYGLEEIDVNKIYEFAPIHDIGKIGIDDNILNKPGRLTSDEFNIIKTHTVLGYEMIENIDNFDFGKNIVLYHHEKWNGLGYPYGLKGYDIPVEARIVALADVYDALRAERPYKKGFTHQKSIEIILEERDISFEPKIVDIFLEYNELFDKIYLNTDN